MKRTAAFSATMMVLLTGCQSADDPLPTVPVPSSTSLAPVPEDNISSGPSSTRSSGEPVEIDAEAASHPWGEGRVEGEPTGGLATGGQEITGVRIGTHEGFDRVVLDLSGDDPELGWVAEFTTEPREDPSGNLVDMEGKAFIDVDVSGIAWTEQPAERYGGSGVSGKGTVAVTEVRFGGLFEGHQQVLIGLRQQTEFRAFVLSDPARIVIDVKHS